MAAGSPRGPREAAGIPQTPHQPGHRGIQTLGHIPGQSLALPLNRSAATEISKSSWERGWRVWIHPRGHKSTASHQQRAFPLCHPRMVTKSFHLIPFPVLIPPCQKLLGSSNPPAAPRVPLTHFYPFIWHFIPSFSSFLRWQEAPAFYFYRRELALP